jgi:SanA protein
VNLLRRPRTWIALALVALGLAIAPRVFTFVAYRDRIFPTVDAVPRDELPRIAIVFGAGLAPHREPSPVLYDRIATAADLYHAGLVRKLLLTGDNRFVNYNEPEAMRAAAIRLGVPENDLVLDYAGRSTYDSCYRAAEIFEVRRAILVTQAFHLDRALYLCNSLGINAIGVAADRREYPGSSLAWWSIREIPATATAWIDVNVWHPTPVMGDRLPIDAEGATNG